jgi:DNA-binding PadR family transcriptional regulator
LRDASEIAMTESSNRAERLLLALDHEPEGLTLVEAVAALGEEGRKSHAATVTMLKQMRDRGRVAYKVDLDTPGAGRRAGVYRITPLGRAWLLQIDPSVQELLPQPDASLLATGSMQGEAPTILRSKARNGQAPAGAIASVFHLGLWQPPPATEALV